MGDNCKVQNYALVYERPCSPMVSSSDRRCVDQRHLPRAINSDGTLKSAHDWEPVGVTIKTGASIGARSTCVAP